MASNETVLWYIEALDTSDENVNGTHTPFQNARYKCVRNASLVAFAQATQGGTPQFQANFAITAHLYQERV